MIIQILDGRGDHVVQASVMAVALLKGKMLTMRPPFVSFEVEDWHEFLGMMWHVCSELTRDSRGAFLRRRMPVAIIQPSGKTYRTEVWFDETVKSLRYVSLQ